MSCVGDIKYSLIEGDHHDWLLCDGRSLLIANYRCLYNVIGNKFGQLSTNTFNLPDIRDKIIGCAGNGKGLTNRNIGDSVGNNFLKLSINNLPNHVHSGTSDIGGIHTHYLTGNGHHTHGNDTKIDGSHGHTMSTTANNLVVYSGTFNTTDLGASNAEDYIGTIALNNYSTAIDSGKHTHIIDRHGYHSHNVSTDNGHIHTFITNNTGGNQLSNNMQPSIIIGYAFIKIQ